MLSISYESDLKPYSLMMYEEIFFSNTSSFSIVVVVVVSLCFSILPKKVWRLPAVPWVSTELNPALPPMTLVLVEVVEEVVEPPPMLTELTLTPPLLLYVLLELPELRELPEC